MGVMREDLVRSDDGNGGCNERVRYFTVVVTHISE